MDEGDGGDEVGNGGGPIIASSKGRSESGESVRQERESGVGIRKGWGVD